MPSGVSRSFDQAVAAEFSLGNTIALEPVAAGAMGKVWRAETERGRFAVKELFDEPSDWALQNEQRLLMPAIAAGVRTPAPMKARSGALVAEVPASTMHNQGSRPRSFARAYEWLDVVPLNSGWSDKGASAIAGDILGRLHLIAPTSQGPVDPWYYIAPDASRLAALEEKLSRLRGSWVTAAREAVEIVAPAAGALAPLISPLRLCHLDIAPPNLGLARDGAIVVFDWDNTGPMDPHAELAHTIVRWCVRDLAIDPLSASSLLEAYARHVPGPRVTPEAFGIALVDQANYVVAHAEATVDSGLPEAVRTRSNAALRDVRRLLIAPSAPNALLGAPELAPFVKR